MLLKGSRVGKQFSDCMAPWGDSFFLFLSKYKENTCLNLHPPLQFSLMDGESYLQRLRQEVEAHPPTSTPLPG